MKTLFRLLAWLCLVMAPVAAQAQGQSIGIVIMHGKGGAPTRLVAGLAQALEGRGYLVANIEMPWSGARNYDVPVAKGEEEVAAAVAGLRGKGAAKIFVAGHSQGGAFALHLAGKLDVDGVVCIAPGGNVANRVFRENLGGDLNRAQRLVADGKGAQPAELADYENFKGGRYPITAIPAAYVTWFDPDGAMNMDRAARAANPRTPILWIVPTRDYPGLLKSSPALFRALPSNPLTRQANPDADHRGAPYASVDEIVGWTREVATAARR
jgi:pimeloyl-ACP methyl ester carboxylesterase